MELASVLKKAIVSELMGINFDIYRHTDLETVKEAYKILLGASLEEITGFIDKVESLKKVNNHIYKGYLHYNEHDRPKMIVSEAEVIEIDGKPAQKYYLAKYKIPRIMSFDVYGMKVYTERELDKFYEQQKECLRASKSYGEDIKKLNDVISSIEITEITRDEYNTLVKVGLGTFGEQSVFDFFTEVYEVKDAYLQKDIKKTDFNKKVDIKQWENTTLLGMDQ